MKWVFFAFVGILAFAGWMGYLAWRGPTYDISEQAPLGTYQFLDDYLQGKNLDKKTVPLEDIVREDLPEDITCYEYTDPRMAIKEEPETVWLYVQGGKLISLVTKFVVPPERLAVGSTSVRKFSLDFWMKLGGPQEFNWMPVAGSSEREAYFQNLKLDGVWIRSSSHNVEEVRFTLATVLPPE